MFIGLFVLFKTIYDEHSYWSEEIAGTTIIGLIVIGFLLTYQTHVIFLIISVGVQTFFLRKAYEKEKKAKEIHGAEIVWKVFYIFFIFRNIFVIFAIFLYEIKE